LKAATVEASVAPEQSTTAEQVAMATTENAAPANAQETQTGSVIAFTAAAESTISGGAVSNGYKATATLNAGVSMSSISTSIATDAVTTTLGNSASISKAANLNSTLTGGPGGQALNESKSTSPTIGGNFRETLWQDISI
jgi:hypothetical protein